MAIGCVHVLDSELACASICSMRVLGAQFVRLTFRLSSKLTPQIHIFEKSYANESHDHCRRPLVAPGTHDVIFGELDLGATQTQALSTYGAVHVKSRPRLANAAQIPTSLPNLLPRMKVLSLYSGGTARIRHAR